MTTAGSGVDVETTKTCETEREKERRGRAGCRKSYWNACLMLYIGGMERRGILVGQSGGSELLVLLIFFSRWWKMRVILIGETMMVKLFWVIDQLLTIYKLLYAELDIITFYLFNVTQSRK